MEIFNQTVEIFKQIAFWYALAYYIFKIQAQIFRIF